LIVFITNPRVQADLRTACYIHWCKTQKSEQFWSLEDSW